MLFLLLISYSVFGQVTIIGQVTSIDGELPGATVQIKGTDRGTIADVEGRFSITVESKDDILVFRFVGYKTKAITASKIGKTKNIVLLEEHILDHPTISYPLIINYWCGVLYNPYGISVTKTKRFYSLNFNIDFDFGYSTNFQSNQDFYGQIGSNIFRREFYYKFQQTTFENLEIKNTITTHLLAGKSNLKSIKTDLFYGIGHQTFSKKGLENNESVNFGVHLGVSKYLRFGRLRISAKSFYWQDYWAWEARLNRGFYHRKMRLNAAISYRQTTQDFKEINLTLGYIF